jgi:hypothetical protein
VFRRKCLLICDAYAHKTLQHQIFVNRPSRHFSSIMAPAKPKASIQSWRKKPKQMGVHPGPRVGELDPLSSCRRRDPLLSHCRDTPPSLCRDRLRCSADILTGARYRRTHRHELSIPDAVGVPIPAATSSLFASPRHPPRPCPHHPTQLIVTGKNPSLSSSSPRLPLRRADE